jgi:hypothetical protein
VGSCHITHRKHRRLFIHFSKKYIKGGACLGYTTTKPNGYKEPSLLQIYASDESSVVHGSGLTGEKVRSFNTDDTPTFVSLESDDKKLILFPSSPAIPKDSDDGGFTRGTGAGCQQWAVVMTIHVLNVSILGVANLKKWCLG